MPFLPESFQVPHKLETPPFTLRPLTIHDLVKDYDAVMSSAAHLKGVFGPGSTWPEGLTLEQNLIDLGWHQKEFQRRRSFTYAVFSPDDSRELGCVYIYPSPKKGFDAQVVMWVRESVLKDGFDKLLFDTVVDWLNTDWPFTGVAYPGRTISWADWKVSE